MKSDANIFYVYLLFRPWDGSPLYVGKGKGDRYRDHFRKSESHPNRVLATAIAKSKKLDLEVPLVILRSNLSEGAAFEIERSMIAAIGRTPYGPLVNLTDGGDGRSGFSVSDATKSKMRIAALGNKNSLGAIRGSATIQKLKDRTFSVETRLKISKAKKGGRLSDDHKAKLSAAKLGTKLSAEHVAKIRAAHLGASRSAEAKARMSAAMRRDPASGRWIKRVYLNKSDID